MSTCRNRRRTVLHVRRGNARSVLILASLLVPGAVPCAWADATRALAPRVAGATNVWLAIADTSAASLEAVDARPPYEPSRRYAAPGCAAGRVYWRRGGGPPPPCTSNQWVPAAAADPAAGLRCAAAAPALRVRGWHGAGRLRQWSPPALQWARPEAGARSALECDDDRGRHGSLAGRWYASEGDATPWAAQPENEIAWDEHPDVYTLYDASYVAWWHGAAPSATRTWRDAQREALITATADFPGSFALLRHSWNARDGRDLAAEGGMVVVAGSSGAAAAGPLATLLERAPHGGSAPLAETLDEAARFLRGADVRYGLASRAAPDVPQPSLQEVRGGPDGTRYIGPAARSCGRAHVSMLSAEAPDRDAGALALLWADGAPGACRTDLRGDCAARYAFRLAQPGVSGAARAEVDWLVAGPRAAWTAALPGPLPRTVDADALPPTLVAFARQRYAAAALATAATTTPQVTGVAASDDAYAGWLVPSTRDRWLGGLRRVRVDPETGAVQPARPADEARLPAPTDRRLYTDVSGAALAAPENRIAVDNALLGAAALGLDGSDAPPRDRVIAWLRGQDVDDADADGDRTESRGEIGAVLGLPALLRLADGRRFAFVGTGDGVLHALQDGTTEAWAYVPGVFLARAASLRESKSSGHRHAGLDGDLRLLTVDRNADRRIDARRGERAILLFGLRRGGRAYFAVDVSDPDAPRLLWSLTPRELPGLGQTWAAAVAARLTIAGTRQNPERLVVLLAGGHEPAQDRMLARPRDRAGAALYLVDAYTGALLWHAAGPGATAFRPDLRVPSLDYGIAAAPRALDLDADGELDRAYVADTGGQVFRFEFTRGAPRATLARAVRLARLGGAAAADRRFYAEPDVALIRRGPGAPYAAVTLGSGFAPEPLARGVADRLYSLRDPLPGAYRSPLPVGPVTDAELPDATAGPVPPDARGWKLHLTLPGERILVPARTLDHRVYVPTWLPPATAAGPDCVQPSGTTRLRVLDLRDGGRRSFRVIEADARPEPEPEALSTGGVAPPLALLTVPAPEGCRRDCRERVTGVLGTAGVPVAWPGSLVRGGWAERGVE